MNRSEFLQGPEARAALVELEEACFAARERGEPEDAFPNPVEFLRERGVEPPESGTISIRHTVEEAGRKVEDLMTPMRPICPGGEDGCRPTKLQNGQRRVGLLLGLSLRVGGGLNAIAVEQPFRPIHQRA